MKWKFGAGHQAVEEWTRRISATDICRAGVVDCGPLKLGRGPFGDGASVRAGGAGRDKPLGPA